MVSPSGQCATAVALIFKDLNLYQFEEFRWNPDQNLAEIIPSIV